MTLMLRDAVVGLRECGRRLSAPTRSSVTRYSRRAEAPPALVLTLLVVLSVGPMASAQTTPLYKLDERDRQARITSDLAAVRVYRDGLRTTLAFVMSHPELFPTGNVKSARMLTREQKEDVWSAWKSFLDYTLAL